MDSPTAIALIRQVLQVRLPDLHQDLLLGDLPGWDSLLLVRLVVLIEETLGRQLQEFELEGIERVGDIVKLVDKPRNA